MATHFNMYSRTVLLKFTMHSVQKKSLCVYVKWLGYVLCLDIYMHVFYFMNATVEYSKIKEEHSINLFFKIYR